MKQPPSVRPIKWDHCFPLYAFIASQPMHFNFGKTISNRSDDFIHQKYPVHITDEMALQQIEGTTVVGLGDCVKQIKCDGLILNIRWDFPCLALMLSSCFALFVRLTYRGQMTHQCNGEVGQHCFRWWLHVQKAWNHLQQSWLNIDVNLWNRS